MTTDLTPAATTPFDAIRHTTLAKEEFHLYVVEFVDWGVKVGISKTPARRIARHRVEAGKFSLQVGRAWTSPPHVEARQNERALIALGGVGNRREYLAVDYDTAVSTALKLPKTPASQALRNAEIARVAAVSFFWPTGTTQEEIVRKASEVFA